jgi:hypothetical protein
MDFFIFWDAQQTVVIQSGYHSEPFYVERGVAQGDFPFPTIFNMVVDAIVRSWAAEVLEQEYVAICGGQDEWLKVALIFYAYDGVLTSYDAILAQTSSDYLVHLFFRVGLNANTKKSNSMVCLPGRVQNHIY